MNPELRKSSEALYPHISVNHIVAASLFVIGTYCSLGAFTRPVRRKIWQRDQGKSKWSGTDKQLEVAHINHDKSNPNYNSESNGRLLGTGEHMWDHINRAGRNGLSENENNWAIITLWKRFWGIRG